MPTGERADEVSNEALAGHTAERELGFNVMWVMFEPGLLQEALGTVVPLLASGDLRPHVAASVPLEAGGHAIESLSNDRPYGSYVLQIA